MLKVSDFIIGIMSHLIETTILSLFWKLKENASLAKGEKICLLFVA